MDKIAITRRRCARGALLTLLFGSPSTAIMARTLEYALMQDDPHISSEIGSHLFIWRTRAMSGCIWATNPARW